MRTALRFLLSGCLLFIAAGCVALEPTGTPTPHPTLVAISRMLTQTRAAPTATGTPTITPTRFVTPSQTVEIPVTGSRKLPAPIDEPFEQGGARVSITAVSDPLIELADQKAPEGQAFLDLKITVENIGDTPIFYNRLDFQLFDADENEFFPVAVSFGPLLLNGTLEPGEFVRGHAAFQIEQPAEGLFLRYRPQTNDGDFAPEAWFELPPVLISLPDGPAPTANWPPTGLPTLGQRVEQDGVALTISDAQVVPRLALGRARGGMQFVSLAVLIENTGRVKTPYNGLYFRMKDAAGYEYIPILGAPEESLQPGSLTEGRRVRGTVFFEIPEDVSEVLVTYQPSVLFEQYPQLAVVVEIPSGGR